MALHPRDGCANGGLVWFLVFQVLSTTVQISRGANENRTVKQRRKDDATGRDRECGLGGLMNHYWSGARYKQKGKMREYSCFKFE